MPPSPKIFPDHFDAIVVGAGHAGCEAAATLSGLGLATLLVTINVDRIGHLSCNPAIGGLAKGHLVREIDALGGVMGLFADAAGIQFRTLNTRKGPAVQATRAQIDRARYLEVVQKELFSREHLWIIQDSVETLIVENGRAVGIRTLFGESYLGAHILLTTGTFLQGLMHVGLSNTEGGRLGDPSAKGLSGCLRELGFRLGRLKTGTTPRLLADSIDFDKTIPQPGDDPPPGFSFHGPGPKLAQVPCYLTYTNERTHEIIREGFARSPMFTGVIKGTGARYCPSIEDKVARFPEKVRHQIFLEPEGLDSPEIYANGIPTSLPLDIQKRLLHSVEGLEHAQIVRPGYAIEYDFVPPTQLLPTLETKLVAGLWCAGQINGTSGYEEAAAQGMWAAFNMACALRGEPPFCPGRDEAYMAVLVDDLVTKGTEEPYRMFTSRAEHRLLLREGNADARLTPLGRRLGLVKDEQWQRFSAKEQAVGELVKRLESIVLTPTKSTRESLEAFGAVAPGKAFTPADILRQPPVNLSLLVTFLPELADVPAEVGLEAETRIKYEGYLKRQQELAGRLKSLESVALPPGIDYRQVAGLTREAVEKLSAIGPATLGQAGRISGITPAALACLEVYLKKIGKL